MNLEPYHLPSTTYNLPLVVIVGPTASGKTSLAVEIAKKYNGEVICADSRSIYKGMDIGTTKPSLIEQSGISHWGLDLVNPNEYFSAADFKKYATQKIDEIRSRGHIPMLVGGTGLYIDSVIFDYQFGDLADENRRNELNKMTLQQLHYYCKENNIVLPENTNNKRYVIRNIERNGTNDSRRALPIDNTIIVGIATEKLVLRSRIEQRIEQIFDDGVVDEAKKLGEIYGWEGEAFKGNVYPLAHQYLLEQMTLDEVKTKLAILDWRLAKRQLTWLKKNPYIQWGTAKEIQNYINIQLAK
ncbi:MAG: tRNA (adenosine(37)-N6)-dimethylallyltransferase MiaA [Candidatus Saccharibacteria bacterium]|jgi:tRNA dimethylallyltransferase